MLLRLSDRTNLYEWNWRVTCSDIEVGFADFMVLEHSIEHSCTTAVACNDEYPRRVFIQTMNNSKSHDDRSARFRKNDGNGNEGKLNNGPPYLGSSEFLTDNS